MKEIVSILLHYFGSFYNTLFYNLSYIKINDKKNVFNIKNIIVILIVGLLMMLNNSYNNLWIKLSVVTIAFCINFKILYKDPLKKIIISYIVIFVTIMGIEIIITNILLEMGLLNNNSSVSLYNISKFILSMFIPLLEYLFFSINIIKKLINRFIDLFIKNLNSLTIAYLLFITFFVLGVLNFENFAMANSVKLIIMLFLLFFILFTIIIKLKTKEEFLKKSNKRLIDYNEKYGQFLDEYKIYKHNIKNKLIGIKSYGNKKVNALIDDLLEEETPFSFKNNNLYNIPNGIKGIVAEKLYNANINVIIDNKLKKDPFLELSPKEFNSISESIGICLDNAIEESLKIKESIITFDLYEDEKNIFIKVGNNFINDLDIDKLGDKYYSTKNRGSGLGLFSIQRNKIVKEKINIINDFYYIELQIKIH